MSIIFGFTIIPWNFVVMLKKTRDLNWPKYIFSVEKMCCLKSHVPHLVTMNHLKCNSLSEITFNLLSSINTFLLQEKIRIAKSGQKIGIYQIFWQHSKATPFQKGTIRPFSIDWIQMPQPCRGISKRQFIINH